MAGTTYPGLLLSVTTHVTREAGLFYSLLSSSLFLSQQGLIPRVIIGLIGAW